MEQTRKIQMNDSIYDVIAKLSDGNPGAVSVCTQIAAQTSKIDPQVGLAEFHYLLWLDDWKIYGSDIWLLYKDICGSRLAHMLALIRSVQIGLLTRHELKNAILYAQTPHSREHKLDVDGLYESVKSVVTQFDRNPKQEQAASK